MLTTGWRECKKGIPKGFLFFLMGRVSARTCKLSSIILFGLLFCFDIK